MERFRRDPYCCLLNFLLDLEGSFFREYLMTQKKILLSLGGRSPFHTGVKKLASSYLKFSYKMKIGRRSKLDLLGREGGIVSSVFSRVSSSLS